MLLRRRSPERMSAGRHPWGFSGATLAPVGTRVGCLGSGRRGVLALGLAAATLLLALPGPARADDFDQELARIDRALVKNPGRVPAAALESCRARRNSALTLYQMGQVARAQRGLAFCRDVLHLSDAPVRAQGPKAPTPEEIAARAARELEQALTLTPDHEHGLAVYRECAACHGPEGWGLSNGSVPQIAGQHRSVVVKQLADMRAGNRDAVLMLPYASVEAIGGPQAVADVAAYIETLEIGTGGDKGPGEDLELGERLYGEHCARCHGASGEGDADAFVPRIHAQHYDYLVRQFRWIRDGKRRNANAEMAAQIQGFDEREVSAVLDYVSRLEPPAELAAPPGWHNPDIAE